MKTEEVQQAQHGRKFGGGEESKRECDDARVAMAKAMNHGETKQEMTLK
jgi:hypothetical protein